MSLASGIIVGSALANAAIYNVSVVLATMLVVGSACLALARRSLRQGWDGTTLAGVAVLACITGLNVVVAGEHVETDRDPGLYWYRALNLARTGLLNAPYNPGAFRSSEIVAPRTGGGFDQIASTDFAFVQFLSAPAIVFSAPVDLVGLRAPMYVSALLLFAASLALLALVRQVLGAPFGCLAAVATALTLPWIYFGRLTYSEPLAAALSLGGIVGIAASFKSRNPTLLVLAFFIVGMSATARLDAGLTVATVVLVASVMAVTLGMKSRVVLAGVAASFLGQCFALIDLLSNSPVYLAAHREQYAAVVCAQLLAVALATAAVVGVPAFNRRSWDWLKGAIAIGCLAVVAWAAYWFLGPEVLDLRQEGPAYDTRSLQRAEGLVEDVGRSYAERLPERVAISVGAAAAVLALIAPLLRWTTQAALSFLPLVAAGVATALVYGVRASITPDLPWALRRLLPILTPTVIVLAVVAIAGVAVAKHGRIFLSLVLLLSVMGSSWPILTHVERRGSLNMLENLCEILPDNASPLFLEGPTEMFARPTEIVCGVPVALSFGPVRYEQLVALDLAWRKHGRRLFVVSPEPLYPGTGAPLERFDALSWQDARLERTLIRRPQQVVDAERRLYVQALP
jgi:hypothetical protein